MRSEIRALRRKISFAYAETVLRERCTEFCLEWEDNVSRGLDPPNYLEFVHSCSQLGFNLPTYTRVLNHLGMCRFHGNPPRPEGLLNLLLPWTTKL